YSLCFCILHFAFCITDLPARSATTTATAAAAEASEASAKSAATTAKSAASAKRSDTAVPPAPATHAPAAKPPAPSRPRTAVHDDEEDEEREDDVAARADIRRAVGYGANALQRDVAPLRNARDAVRGMCEPTGLVRTGP